jgi:hypothetical protein
MSSYSTLQSLKSGEEAKESAQIQDQSRASQEKNSSINIELLASVTRAVLLVSDPTCLKVRKGVIADVQVIPKVSF